MEINVSSDIHNTRLFRAVKNNLPFYSEVRGIYRHLQKNARFFKLAVSEGLWQARIGISGHSRESIQQKALVWDASLPDCATAVELITWLRARGIELYEGGHTIYIPPQERLHEVIPSVVKFYPENSGFKILKDFRAPDEAAYLTKNRTWMRNKIIGTPEDQLIPANYMHSLGLGPRVWDVSCWQSGNTSRTAFVVEHINGASPSRNQCDNFLKKIKQILSNSYLRLSMLNWEDQTDFQPPDCNNNLLVSNKHEEPQYIDFQNFCITDPMDWTKDVVDRAKDTFHFGNGRPLRGAKYLYQSVPGMLSVGKRNTTRRWKFIEGQLRKSGINILGRVVLDVGCNAGMILNSCLSSGAAWALGWDRPPVAQFTEELLLSLGSSRFKVTGANLNSEYALEQDIPAQLQPMLKEAIVFYLSVRQHIGLSDSLKRIPWRVLVYEGHQGERLEDVPEVLNSLLSDEVKVIASAALSDGDSAPRPLVILLRK